MKLNIFNQAQSSAIKRFNSVFQRALCVALLAVFGLFSSVSGMDPSLEEGNSKKILILDELKTQEITALLTSLVE